MGRVVDRALFDAVQAKLEQQNNNHKRPGQSQKRCWSGASSTTAAIERVRGGGRSQYRTCLHPVSPVLRGKAGRQLAIPAYHSKILARSPKVGGLLAYPNNRRISGA